MALSDFFEFNPNWISSECNLIPWGSDLRKYLNKNNYTVECSESWNFARICIGWTLYDDHVTALKAIDMVREAFKDTDLVIYFDGTVIEFVEPQYLEKYEWAKRKYKYSISHENALRKISEKCREMHKISSQKGYEPKFITKQYKINGEPVDVGGMYFISHANRQDAFQYFDDIKAMLIENGVELNAFKISNKKSENDCWMMTCSI